MKESVLVLSVLITAAGCGYGCTVVSITKGPDVFFGCNDDYHNRDSTYWVDPGGNGRYGAVYFGNRDNVQQGFNEKGLAYDATGLPSAPVTYHPFNLHFSGGHTDYPIAILRECGTVTEVIVWIKKHRWPRSMHYQLHFADDSGDAVIVSAGPDGRVAYTRTPPGDSFLVSTNFNAANQKNGSYPCKRYTTAENRLSEIITNNIVSVDDITGVMEAVHVEHSAVWTLYSLVADLRKGLVYVYFMFQYDAPVVLDIESEIEKGPKQSAVSSLFPDPVRDAAAQQLEKMDRRIRRGRIYGLFWISFLFLCTAAALLIFRGSKNVFFPVVMTLLLGPAGFLLTLILLQRRVGSLMQKSAVMIAEWSIGRYGTGLAQLPVIWAVGSAAALVCICPVYLFQRFFPVRHKIRYAFIIPLSVIILVVGLIGAMNIRI